MNHPSLKKSSICRLVLCLLWLLPGTIMAQQMSVLDSTLSLRADSLTVFDALQQLARQTGHQFSYPSGTVNDSLLRHQLNHTAPLRQLLDSLLQSPDLDYQELAGHIIIKQRSATPNTDNAQRTWTAPITGLVADAENHHALPYASVALLGKPTGTITNANGRFRYNLGQAKPTDTLCFSYIGYRRLMVPVSELYPKRTVFYLQREMVSLQEVLIRHVPPAKLLAMHQAALNSNYPNEQALQRNYYRESVMRHATPLLFAEAVVDVFQKPYQVPTAGRVKLVKARKFLNHQRMDTVLLKLKGGLQTCLNLDLVRHPPTFLEVGEMAAYHYNMTNISVHDGREAYELWFAPAPRSQAIFEGRMLFDCQTGALVHVRFNIANNKLQQAQDQFLVRKSRAYSFKLLSAAYQVSYKELGGKFYLSHVRADMGFRLRSKRKLFAVRFNSYLEMANAQTTLGTWPKPTRQESLNTGAIFFDEPYTYDPHFWGTYNTIELERSIEDILKDIDQP